MAVLVAEDHLVVDRVERDAVEGRKRIGHRSDGRDDAADGVGRPLVGGDRAFLRQTPRCLRNPRRHIVDAIFGEEIVERSHLAGTVSVRLRRSLAAGEQQNEGRRRGRNQYATHNPRSVPRGLSASKNNGRTKDQETEEYGGNGITLRKRRNTEATASHRETEQLRRTEVRRAARSAAHAAESGRA